MSGCFQNFFDHFIQNKIITKQCCLKNYQAFTNAIQIEIIRFLEAVLQWIFVA